MRWWMLGLVAVVAIAVLTLMMPVPTWRTGRADTPPLALAAGERLIGPSDRIWIDTDAACGAGARVDPDDCFAVALLLRARGEHVVGVSTVFGNAPIAVTDATTCALVDLLDARSVRVFRGAPAPLANEGGASEAQQALRAALAEGPLTIVALGPLTNIANALVGQENLQANVKRLIAVMGHQRDHVFHPTEGAPGAMLLGHGPVFRDFNFAQDQEAARRILAMDLALVLVPYDASRSLMVGEADLDRLSAGDAASRWIAARSRDWLGYWQRDIAQSGFYPFDLAAAAYVLHPTAFACAQVVPGVVDRGLLWSWILGPDELVVEPAPEDDVRTLYCPSVAPALKDELISTIARG